VPFDRPEITHDVVVVEHVAPPGEAVATYPVITDPPLATGAVHETDTAAFERVAATAVDTPGVVASSADDDAAEGALSPATLIASTVTV
jgi:hypothetical protein